MTPAAGVPLAPLTTLKVGGPAQWYVEARTAADAAAAIAWAADRSLPLFVLGGGSNLVVADEGLRGLVLHVRMRGVTFADADTATLVSAAAGEDWDGVVAATVERGLAGLECLSGIPGTVGATPVQNVGAYGQEVGRVIDHVEVVDTEDRRVRTLTPAECAFSYRMSRFKGSDAGRFIVTRVAFRLAAGAPALAYPDVITYFEQRAIMSPGVADVRQAVLAIRRRKGMVIDAADPDTRSVGSFFVNPVVSTAVHESLTSRFGPVPSFPAEPGRVKIPAAWLIERAGIARGFRRGAAAVSSKHPLALVSGPGATARELVGLAAHIKRTVADRFGIALRPEPVIVGFGDDAAVAYLQGLHVDTAD